jgi:hypothetical protein
MVLSSYINAHARLTDDGDGFGVAQPDEDGA